MCFWRHAEFRALSMKLQGAPGYIHCSSLWVCVYFSYPAPYPEILKVLYGSSRKHTLLQSLGLCILLIPNTIPWNILSISSSSHTQHKTLKLWRCFYFVVIQGVHLILCFFRIFKIFRTLAFLCFPSVSVCVHTPGR